MEVKDIVKEAIIVTEDTSFRECLKTMVDRQTNTLLVVDGDGKLVGEVTVADLLDAIVPEYLDGDSIAANFATEDMFKEAVLDTVEKEARYFMSTDYSAVRMTDGLMAIAANAIAFQRARIPVVDAENRPVGIISRRGLKHILATFLGITDTTSS